MTERLLALGDYRFAVDTAAYQTIEQETQYRWAEQPRLGKAPGQQFLGAGTRSMTISGIIYPAFVAARYLGLPGEAKRRVAFGQIDRMKDEAAKGVPLNMTDDLGFYHGKWVILAVRQTDDEFGQKGMPKRQQFAISLKYYPDSHNGNV